MTQSTKNDIDGEHFFWTIEKNNRKLQYFVFKTRIQ